MTALFWQAMSAGRLQREDDVEVADRQQLRLTLGEPLLCRCALAFWACRFRQLL